MKIFKPLKFLAPALALFSAAFFPACKNSSSAAIIPYYIAPDQQTTIDGNKECLTLTNVMGKTIYMTRTNPLNKTLKKENSRTAVMSSGSAASASKSMADFSDSGIALGFDLDGTSDPHKKIYDLAIQELENAKGAAIQKSAQASIQAMVKDYAPGDTEKFWALDPETLNRFYKRTFKLLASGDNYNVWVDINDQYYTADTDSFAAAAQKLGTNFINGYGLVSHLYGEPADKLYNEDYSVYGDMASESRTGLKINMMLYDMLTVGKVYGFVYHGDVHKGVGGSNEGRFVYIDSQTTVKQPLEAYSTAQHEFSHTISKNQKALHGKEWTYWYGELLAMMCEDMMQAYFGISDSDVNDKLGNTPKTRLPQANALAWSNGLSGEESLAYASVFQFGAWLSRNFGGAKFIKELAQNAYVDMESILNAVNAMGETKYTTATLLQKFSGDLLKAEIGKGLLQDAPTYLGDAAYTCAYTDAAGQNQTYLYPITAINLWDSFYAWCDTAGAKYSPYCVNLAVPFAWLPAANMYKKGDWKGNPPAVAYLGPFVFKNGGYLADIGPYGTALFYLGTATSDSVTITFSCKGNAEDVITIYAK